jgi:predicted 3-demethylubiquinone-9 3-methyltransferase (glyoxalase superfamily)
MKAQQKIVPNLWFDGVAKEAAEFYVSVFKDAEITETTYYPTEGLADFQKPLAGKELTVGFRLLDTTFVAINAGPEFKFNESVSFVVPCKDQAEIDYFWEKLSAVPESEQCGWCKDKYGLSWQIVPENMDELMASPKAFPVLMQQHKIIIAELEAAN